MLVADGLAYAAAGKQLNVVDLASATVVQSLTLPGIGTLTGFAREGTFLYAFVSGSDTFSVIGVADEGRPSSAARWSSASPRSTSASSSATT